MEPGRWEARPLVSPRLSAWDRFESYRISRSIVHPDFYCRFTRRARRAQRIEVPLCFSSSSVCSVPSV